MNTEQMTDKQIADKLERISADQERRIVDQLDPSDCALSSWADGITSGLLRLEQELRANGGYGTFLVLRTVDGEPVSAKMIRGKYGDCWAILDEKGRISGQFVAIADAASEPGTPYVAKDKNLRKKGFIQIAERRKAIAKVVGYGRGLSGNAWPAVIDPKTGQGQCAWLPTE